MGYIRKAYYHETDQMGVIHHSNYVKWMEEARIYYLNSIGLSYKKIEDEGFISPVLGISLEYKNSVLFEQEVVITVKPCEYTGVKLSLKYEIREKETNKLCVVAESKHCFLKGGRIISLKKEMPIWHEKFEAELNASN